MKPRHIRKLLLFLGSRKYGLTGGTLRLWVKYREAEMIEDKASTYKEAVAREEALEI